MLDINQLRADLGSVAAGLAKRGVTLDAVRFEALQARRKDIQTRTQDLQQRRNALWKQVGNAKSRGEDAAPILAEIARDERRSGKDRIGAPSDHAPVFIDVR